MRYIRPNSVFRSKNERNSPNDPSDLGDDSADRVKSSFCFLHIQVSEFTELAKGRPTIKNK